MQTSRLNSMMVIWKKTGRIKPASYPRFIGRKLYDVYNSYSQDKANAYQYCMEILQDDIGMENVIQYGITSKNTFCFTFSCVFRYEGKRYVMTITRNYDKIYILDEDEVTK